ncbi:MAG TPA: hypothetical protein EYN51_04085 [Flavobacteriales bacterium]|nr:hypothetical protein [Flavobacteriales bacterium]
MIGNLPVWIEILFILTCIGTIGLFYYSNSKPKVLILFIILLSIVQSILAYNGFYQITDSIPPRFLFVILPSLLVIIYGLLPKQIAWVMNNRNTKISTFLHVVRLPVEIILLYLFLNKMIPQLMTFEGINYDILIGITAPIIGFLYLKIKISKTFLMYWNIIGLILVLFIMIIGTLSAELPFQQFAFEQPNRGLQYFPFILLPVLIVPLVIYAHITDIIKLKKEITTIRNTT